MLVIQKNLSLHSLEIDFMKSKFLNNGQFRKCQNLDVRISDIQLAASKAPSKKPLLSTLKGDGDGEGGGS